MSAKRGRRTTVYFPLELLGELHAEAERQHKTLSHMIRIAWKLSRGRIASFRVAPEVERPKRSDAA